MRGVKEDSRLSWLNSQGETHHAMARMNGRVFNLICMLAHQLVRQLALHHLLYELTRTTRVGPRQQNRRGRVVSAHQHTGAGPNDAIARAYCERTKSYSHAPSSPQQSALRLAHRINAAYTLIGLRIAPLARRHVQRRSHGV